MKNITHMTTAVTIALANLDQHSDEQLQQLHAQAKQLRASFCTKRKVTDTDNYNVANRLVRRLQAALKQRATQLATATSTERISYAAHVKRGNTYIIASQFSTLEAAMAAREQLLAMPIEDVATVDNVKVWEL